LTLSDQPGGARESTCMTFCHLILVPTTFRDFTLRTHHVPVRSNEMIGLNSTKLAYEQTKRRHGKARTLVYNGRVSGYQIGFVVPKYQEICSTGSSVWKTTAASALAGCATGAVATMWAGPGAWAGCGIGAATTGAGGFVYQ